MEHVVDYSVTILTVLPCYSVTVLQYYHVTISPQTVPIVIYSATFFVLLQYSLYYYSSIYASFIQVMFFLHFSLQSSECTPYLSHSCHIPAQSPLLLLSPWKYFMDRQNSWVGLYLEKTLYYRIIEWHLSKLPDRWGVRPTSCQYSFVLRRLNVANKNTNNTLY